MSVRNPDTLPRKKQVAAARARAQALGYVVVDLHVDWPDWPAERRYCAHHRDAPPGVFDTTGAPTAGAAWIAIAQMFEKRANQYA